ncbi:MAG: SRPBCC family protein [bacterium]
MASLKINRSLTIAAPVEVCHAFWSDPMNFKRTFDVVVEVVPLDDGRSRWTLNLPSGKQDDVIMMKTDSPGGVLTWSSAPGAITFNTAFVFVPADNGTAMTLETEIGMGGLQGMMLPAMRPVIEQRIDTVLERFKQAVAGSAS